MKIAYAGAPAFSVLPLQAILEAGYPVSAVITQPDRPFGRKGVLTPTPLKAFAEGRGIPVYTYPKIRGCAEEVRALGADILVTCAYGQILTQEILDAFPRGVYNIHASLLPRWRGASPIQHAILAGDAETGVTVMRTELGLDTGDMLCAARTAVSEEDTAETLAARLSALGGRLIAEALKAIEEGRAVFTKQDEAAATVCTKIKKDGCALDFAKSAQELSRLVRAMNPEPLAFTRLNGKLFNVYFAAATDENAEGVCGEVVRADKTGIYVKTGEGTLKILQMQPEGGKKLSACDLVNGRKVAVGDVFGSEA